MQEESKTMRKINGFSRKMISKWWVLHIYVRFPESTFDIIWFNLGEWWFGGEYVSPFSSRNLFDNMCILSVSGYLNLASAHLCKIQRPQNDLITTKTSPQMLRIGEIMGKIASCVPVWNISYFAQEKKMMCIDVLHSHAFTLKRLILEFWSWSFNCSSL